MDKDLALLHEKVDTLMSYMEAQQKQQQAFNELKDDMIPIANHMIKLSIDELADIGTEFRSEDLLFLVKRILRDTHLFIKMMDQLEAVMGLADEVQLLGKQVFSSTVETLDELERKGYFAFASQGMQIADRIVTDFNNIPDSPPSAFKLLTELRDPQVRMGMARMLNMLKAIGEQPDDPSKQN